MAVNQTGARPGAEPPITAEALLALDNVAAKREPPAHVAEQLATRRLDLSRGDGGEGIEHALEAVERHADGVSLSLPASVAVGRPGRTLEVFNREELEAEVGALHHAPGLMPEWAELVYHPKLAAPPGIKWMRTFDGRRVMPHPYFVYGADNRHVYYPKGYPWHCIGKVDIYASAKAENPWTWGGGVLIGDRIVLTAGHLVGLTKPHDWKIRFTAAMYNGDSIVGPGGVSYVSDARWWGDDQTGRDIGLLRLYEPIGTSLGYFGAKTYDSSWNNHHFWTLCGYGEDIGAMVRPSRQVGIAVLDVDTDGLAAQLEHRGDIDIGDSGGPFFGFWAPDPIPYAVGTTSGGTTVGVGEDVNFAAGGALMVRAIARARLDWPA